MSARTLPTIAAVAVLLAAAGRAPAFDLSPGQPFPHLALPDVADNTPRSIDDFAGHKTLVHLFAGW